MQPEVLPCRARELFSSPASCPTRRLTAADRFSLTSAAIRDLHHGTFDSLRHPFLLSFHPARAALRATSRRFWGESLAALA